ncbi:hypothetical protein OEZ86_002238 [Tetradesmus obliquus]|nr:hypothetical protein OEZ86_002238 [Tetradesmus obliquus]
MGRKVLLGLAVLVCAFAASNGRSTEAIGEFWTKGNSNAGQQQAGAAVAAVPTPSKPAVPTSAAAQKAVPSRPAGSQTPAAATKPAAAVPRRSTAAKPQGPGAAAPGAARRASTPAAARGTPAQPRHQPTTKPSRPAAAHQQPTSGSRAIPAAPVTPQQGPGVLPPLFPPTVIRPPLAGGGEPMTRFSKDIRGLQLSIVNIKLTPTTMSPDGQKITGFTFAGDLQCMAAATMPIVGSCYISAGMLADDGQAMATAICVTNTNAPNCDPQLTGSLTITATGLLTVNMGTTTTPAASSSSTALVKAADNSTQLVSSFNTVTPLIVDGVYSSSRPDTLLSSIVGFKRGNLDIPNVKWSNGTYTGSMTLSMFKGPVL